MGDWLCDLVLGAVQLAVFFFFVFVFVAALIWALRGCGIVG